MKLQYEKTAVQIKELVALNKNPNPKSAPPSIIRIPVVFHVLHLNGPENISDAQIYDQVRILNRDYQKQNADTIQVAAAFKNNIADVGFEFHLAKIDPEGKCTNGIVRHYTNKTNWNADRLEDFIYTWPADRYLNIYVVKSINVAPAYTFLPGIGIPASADAIVCESWLVGSIGTATSANSRALTHEVGHWFGLPHIWGVSNAPGVECGDDFVDDTPVTKGFVACSINNARICNSNIHENVQNYMDYSPCKLMFTNGQAAYMRETITLGLNNRNHLISEANLIETGIAGNIPCSTLASFYAAYYAVCKGETIRFYSESRTGSPTISQTWFIPGALPAVSTDSIVDVTFPEAGSYEVKLVVSGPNGVDSLSKYIEVYDGSTGKLTPVVYNFDDGFLPSELHLANNDPTGTGNGWETTASIGANNTKGCIVLKNAGPSAVAYFETPFFDFSDNSKPSMSFYYAYAKQSETQIDSFRLEYTLDCGKSWRVFPNIPNTTAMANNTGGVSSAPFFPESPEKWRKLNLQTTFTALFKNKASVKFRFYFKSDPASDGSNNFFIDEININNESISGIQHLNEDLINIYPNPATSDITIEISGAEAGKYTVEMGNLMGQSVLQPASVSIAENRALFKISDTHQIPAGVYHIKVKKQGYNDIIKKIVIFK